MRSTTKRITVLWLAAVVALAGCGDKGSTTTQLERTGSTQPVVELPKPAPVPEAAVAADLREALDRL